MTDVDEFLGASAVQEFRDSEEYEQAARALVVDVYAETRLDADSVLEEAEATTTLKNALQELATESENPPATIDAAKTAAGTAAQKLQEPREDIVGLIDDGTRDLLDEHREARLDSGEGLSVPEGIGLDEYLEDELDEIVRQQSTDAVDEPVLRWRFADGARIETSESIHHDWYALFKKLASATDKRLVPELASEQVEDELRDEEDADGEAYARLSLGPKTRPWHTNNALWSRAISGLVQERIRTETVVGPRTDAWESLQARIRSGRAVEDLVDAVEHGMIHVDDDSAEVWIPTTMVDNAADKVETSRRAIQAELGERGVTSSELSGERVSEAVSRGGTAMRFWRLDLEHDAVPEPETVLDEIEDPVDQLGAAGDDSSAAADGGTTTPQHTTERFGRSPEWEDDEQDTDDGTESPENGGDRDDDTADPDGGPSDTTDASTDASEEPPDGEDNERDGGSVK
jgi:hypothetical protein